MVLGRLAVQHFLKMVVPFWSKREIMGLLFVIPVRENTKTLFVK